MEAVMRRIPFLAGSLVAVLASVSARMLGLDNENSVFSAIALAPIFFWELSVGLWMTFKGFDRSALARLGFAEGDGDWQAPARSRTAAGERIA
jgi:hypothetical protein